MAQVVAIVLDAAEGDAAQSVDLQRALSPTRRGSDVDIGFFARADLLACGVEDLTLLVRVQGEVIEASVGETVAIVCGSKKISQASFDCGQEPTMGKTHLAFLTRAMRFTLARVEMHLCAPLPPRRPDSWTISGVGTIS